MLLNGGKQGVHSQNWGWGCHGGAQMGAECMRTASSGMSSLLTGAVSA